METTILDPLLALASTQFGVFSVRQAAAYGVTNSMLDNAVARGWLRRERRGVYAISGLPPSLWRPVYAAALAAGPRAALSHTSAATVHSLHGVASDGIELTVPYGSFRHLDGVRVHRSRTLTTLDLEERRGLLVTTPVRTLIDLAARFRDPLLGVIVDEGTISGVWTPESIATRLDQLGGGLAGRAELRRTLALRVGEGRPDSPLEQRIIRVVKPAFPGFKVHHQVVLDGEVIEMDLAWIPEKIDGEVDGMFIRAHSRSKFERTALRANILARHGWRIVHLTHPMDDRTILAQLAPFFPR